MSEYGVLLTTLPGKEVAQRIARLLVEARLAACVQIMPIESVYRWEGKVQQEGELLLFIKTRTALFDAATLRIKAEHPYAVPEIVGMPFSAGHQPYLDWIADSTLPTA
jgi:periplasmic divalent cation tolerance protein